MFPSRTLALYMAKMFLLRFAAFLLLLTLVIQSLDLINESDKILVVPGAGYASLGKYMLWRIPQLASLFAPFAVLLATLLTLMSLNQNSEIIIMKASGLSAHQLLRPLFFAALFVAFGHFIFNELVLVPSTAKLSAWQATNYGAKPAESADMPKAIWIMDGNNIVHAQDVRQEGGQLVLDHLIVFARQPANQGRGFSLVSLTRANTARLVNDNWQLFDVHHTDVAHLKTTQKSLETWQTRIPPERFMAVAVNPKQVNFMVLQSAIHNLQTGKQTRDVLTAALNHKVTGPLSAVLMPLLGAVAAFGVARSGKLFVRLVAGLVIGFSYFVTDNFMVAMGQFGTIPPVLAAWAPFILFFLIGEAILLNSEE